MKLGLIRFLLAVLLCPGLRADFNAEEWRYRRLVQGAGQGQIAFFFPDPVLYQGSLGRLDDLRLIQGGTETAYLFDVSRPNYAERDIPATLLNRSVVPGEGLRFTLDAGAGAPPHDQVKIDTERTNFRSRVKIETSDDGRAWTVARTDGVIFDVSQADKAASELSVRFPRSTFRYVRVTIEGWKDPDSVKGASLVSVVDDPGERERVFSLDHPSAVEDREAQSTNLILDIGYAGLPHDLVRFTIEGGPFSRTVAIDSSTNREQWVDVAQHTIFRADRTGELSVVFPEQWDRYLRLRVLNHDDRPLTIRRVELEAPTRKVRFRAVGSGEVWLYYGKVGARAPTYDLTALEIGNGAAKATLGAQELNTAYREPAKNREQNPIVLYVLLGLAILVMGFLTIRMLKRVQG